RVRRRRRAREPPARRGRDRRRGPRVLAHRRRRGAERGRYPAALGHTSTGRRRLRRRHGRRLRTARRSLTGRAGGRGDAARGPLPAPAYVGHHGQAEGSHVDPRQRDVEHRQPLVGRRFPHRRRHDRDRALLSHRRHGSERPARPFAGGAIVVPERADADEILRLMEEHRVTIGFGNPDLLESLTRSPRWPATDLSSIRFFITGGAPVPERLIRMYLERGVTFLQGYGLSEAAPFVSLLDAPSALRKFGSAGTPALFVDVKAVRRDGSECAPDETGELLVRGTNVMVGYWRRPEATGAALVGDGWLRTGDVA